MRRMILTLCLVLLIGLLSGTDETYLMSIPTKDHLDSNLLNVYFIDSDDIIVANSVEEIQQLRISEFRILDSFNESKDYFILENRVGVPEEIPWGKIVYRSDDFTIVRKNSGVDETDILEPKLSKIELPSLQVFNVPENLRNSRDLIDDLIANISADSIESVIQSLEDFETRYCYADNRDEVADWILDKFVSYGYTDAIQDSFQYNNTWQKNIIAVLPGVINDEEYIIFGGHHDSICPPTSMTYAPGADDNASATANVLELARVLMGQGYQPDVNLVFVTFAAEEVGLVGSDVLASGLNAQDYDVKFMLNNDMVANNTMVPGEWEVAIYAYTGSEYLADYATFLCLSYTNLNPVVYNQNSSGSDSFSFWTNGFPVVYFEESEFSPNWHQPTDTIDNCDIDFCKEIAKLDLATIVSIDRKPNPVENFLIYDVGNGHDLQLEWDANTESDFDHYRIAVGLEPGAMNDFYITTETSFLLEDLFNGLTYYVGIVAVDNEDFFSFEVEKSAIPGFIPAVPQGVVAEPALQSVLLAWQPNLELDLLGYNVYRSETMNGNYTLLNSDPIQDEFYSDTDIVSGQYYYYFIKAEDLDQNESNQSDVVSSRAITLDSGILILDNTANGSGNYGNPEETDCDQFYQNVLDGFSYEEMNLEETSDLTTEAIGIYSTVILHMNSNFPSCNTFPQVDEIKQYLDNGGKILVTAFKPSEMFTDYSSYPATFNENDFLYDYFKIESIDLNNMTRFYYADPEPGFNMIEADTTKTLPALDYHLFNIETIAPNNDGELLFSWGSNYANTNPFGVMNGEPVGVGYFGNDFKSALFSFPFYYMQQDDVSTFLNTLLVDYFDEQVGGIDPNIIVNGDVILKQNYPNPFNPVTTIEFSLSDEELETAELEIYNIKGQKVRRFSNQELVSSPNQRITWEGKDDFGKHVSSGLYFYRLKRSDNSVTKRMLLIK
ncbi:MAG: M20/M25/M40 family metallo-hydrolase [Candidatus Cloacimonetes bacterium]|nr:M20/M25/M40 family metallo-hydrolase [Candidatus Cloacimonadota bacterium]MCF7814940.1 M20/M25/M40 family metallo-hydrolase [Candidatus Cloacimonadota bacterium]MCF7867328.1 M20/M25/M40 family metallo-hydrolase [Candidatus Cloacimonadota bacterium]MCF7882762.1 M20/M25/M40 family metallo-hydrolase [Candidatus Cloacimonadota bacterium]